MGKRSVRCTIELDPELHAALRNKTARTNRSLSQLVNDAVRAELSEDDLDLADAIERRYDPTLTLAELLDELKANRRE